MEDECQYLFTDDKFWQMMEFHTEAADPWLLKFSADKGEDEPLLSFFCWLPLTLLEPWHSSDFSMIPFKLVTSKKWLWLLFLFVCFHYGKFSADSEIKAGHEKVWWMPNLAKTEVQREKDVGKVSSFLWLLPLGGSKLLICPAILHKTIT